MPFPLAHPAAVLPLRRLCPRWLDFPALIIGSLCPDVGYCFGRLHVDQFSHRFLAGSFGFCLPVGLFLLVMFYLLRRPVTQLLPARLRRVFEPLCMRPSGSTFAVIVSLLIGAWTHITLDSMTHENGRLVGSLPILQTILFAGNCQLKVCDVLYAAGTFAGIIYLALVYMKWLEQTMGEPGWVFPGFKWVAAGIFAALVSLLSLANHKVTSLFGLTVIIALTVILTIVFFLAMAMALRAQPGDRPCRPAKKTSADQNSQLAEGC